ncbi:MAG: polysaccharide deacetylase family protein [Pseudomonadota bacterium]
MAAPSLACADPENAIGVARIVEIDTSQGPLFGKITQFRKQPPFLKPDEVVLTFDDGPTPDVTLPILKTLAKHCTLATFFPIGKRALKYPRTLRAIQAAGHTLGAHTWSHPRSLAKLSPADARKQIERGFAAVALAAGKPIAPFFRFPGLSDSAEMLAYTQLRRLATFSVDVVSDDSYAKSTEAIVDTVFARIKKYGAGVMLFHDIKRRTVDALPIILAELKARGFKVVHIRAKTPVTPDPAFRSMFTAALAKGLKSEVALRPTLRPVTTPASPPVVALSPEQPPFAPQTAAQKK